MFSRLIRLALLFCLLLVMLAVVLVQQTKQFARQELPVSENKTILLQQGGSLNSLLLDLQKQGLIQQRWPYRLYAKLLQQEKVIAGEYALLPGDSFETLLARIASGEVVEYQLVIPEGLNFQEWLAQLEEIEELQSNETITAADIDPALTHIEGWLFPDTYYFHRGDSELDILRRAYRRMVDILEQEWQGRADNLPYQNPYQALIMASIIEKETGVPEERGEIAGVFVRRLQKGMRLQSDPTVIYGLGNAYQGNITRLHLKQSTPYNTYTEKGLPPTPIAMPGREAIHAALNPEPGDALYFVARGDGSHYFSDTLEEHLAAVRRYQLQRREGYRSSPDKSESK